MTDSLLTSTVTIVMAIIGVAIIAILVSKNANTAGVLGAGSSAVGGLLQAAESPISGSSYGSLAGYTGGAA